jgi:ribose-phosphate pyrophosphokinase
MISVNGWVVQPTIFPDKTSQVWKLPFDIRMSRHVFIEWVFEQESEFLWLAQLKELFDNHGADSDLSMPYLPYGRQDKQIVSGDAFALRTFARLINHLNFYRVTCIDPHSEVAAEMIKNLVVTPATGFIESACKEAQPDILCYPDEGARQKYSKLINREYIWGEKIRDHTSGTILSYKLMGAVIARKVLIVDDICDGGATFTWLSRELLKAGAREISLYVTHGLFTKGLDPLIQAGIDRIFTKDGEIQFKKLKIKPYGNGDLL